MEEEGCDLPSISERFAAQEASWLAVWVQIRHRGDAAFSSCECALVCVCVCVCVCERETERERDRERERGKGRQRMYVCTHMHEHSEPVLLRIPGAQSESAEGVALMAAL